MEGAPTRTFFACCSGVKARHSGPLSCSFAVMTKPQLVHTTSAVDLSCTSDEPLHSGHILAGSDFSLTLSSVIVIINHTFQFHTNICCGGFPMISLMYPKTCSEGLLGTRLNSINSLDNASLTDLLVYPNLSAWSTEIVPFIVTICNSSWYNFVKLGGTHSWVPNHVLMSSNPSAFRIRYCLLRENRYLLGIVSI